MALTEFAVGRRSVLKTINIGGTVYTQGTSYITENVSVEPMSPTDGDITLHNGNKLNHAARSQGAIVNATFILNTESSEMYKRLLGATDYTEHEDNDCEVQIIPENTDAAMITYNKKVNTRCLMYFQGDTTLEGGAIGFEVVVRMDEVDIS